MDIRHERFSAASRSGLRYGDAALRLEDVSLEDVAASVATPFYCYSSASIRSAYERLSQALAPVGASICFAVKANGNLSVLSLLAELGSGMDIVSGGELERTLAAGAPAAGIVFSGVGKKRGEIRDALKAGIHQINVESAAELDAIADVARELGLRAPVAFRYNPDVDAGTHTKISTGRKDDKFGMSGEEILDAYARAATLPELDVVGLAVHIGSQLLDLEPFRQAYTHLANLVMTLRGRGLSVTRLDLGGGIGISYDGGPAPDVEDYGAIVSATLGGIGCALTVEPGRWLVGPAGVLVTEVLYLKEAGETPTVIVDAAMNDLMRPALYGSLHAALPVRQNEVCGDRPVRIAGPVCESSDIFGTYAGLPALSAGDLLAFTCTGAYGASMASTYNARALVPEVLVEGNRFRVIRRRQETAELLVLEEPTQWQIAGLAAEGRAVR
ncbi:diaminopimelate decarboxylase [Aquamicrobium sp. NLF2-7]|uniref:diaminopimelate decarboxylase n=1 Tax=Aquamicrobium sp. NLF2-7 TaxID=2918753 RepID=UPI001EFBA561|nr:diaminopimelate decarboxylase [Aquamicrobium sp. NLF2-7]MCG8273332.1 diaminopimelate decarboxylase [Aquamicrobium sp. NLF2-7]